MTAKKCKCHPNSPFLWAHSYRPSIFIKDPYFKGLNAASSQSQTQVVERKRAAGEEVGTINNLSNRAKEKSIISLRQFTIFSKAGQVL